MFDSSRMVVILLNAGYNKAEIAKRCGIVPGSVGNLVRFPNRSVRLDTRPLYRMLCQECAFPWSREANTQLRAMAEQARGENPGVLRELFEYVGERWIAEVKKAQDEKVRRLDEAQWATLALAYTYLVGTLASKPDKGETQEIRESWGIVSRELLRRLTQFDVRREVDHTWIKILSHDVISNRLSVIISPGELNRGDIDELGRTIEDTEYFKLFKEFNDLVPRCHKAPLNGLCFASALKRSDLYEDFWLKRLVRADDTFEDCEAILMHKDAGPELDHFGDWARERKKERNSREAMMQ